MVAMRRALISVSDKSGLVEFARALAGHGYELISTGGSARALAEAGLKVTEVAAVTGFPEIMDGRVKTLHPAIHGGLLALRDNPAHLAAMAEHGIGGIDLLVVNLYPFEATLAAGGGFAECIENIDIGGPAMIRAAAKNIGHVGVITDIADYEPVLADMGANQGSVSEALRARLSARAFARTAAYDAAISRWLAGETGEASPRHMTLGGTLRQELRYGENPHQSARFYTTGETRAGVATARQVQGKALSYNNINDTDAAFELVADLPRDRAGIAIIKHANPCGVAMGSNFAEAYGQALACDPVSAFGGIVALNGRLDAGAAQAIVKVFTEVVIAPEADDEALEILTAKPNIRVLLTGGLPDPEAAGLNVRTVAGGFLVQGRDGRRIGAGEVEVVTARAPSAAEMADLIFAFRVAKHVKSNAIVYAKDGVTAGIGAGQMSRIDASQIAAAKAVQAAKAAGRETPLTIGSAVASDAFFPFADGLLAAAEAGATAVIQPGGSMRDKQVIAAADEAGLAMVFTGVRHFRH
ncbi:IMP cyclohydrolase / Phosphoribosylaminoimidazolecarboxamide formyltransferase [hydrothermal vent metagenome]|uniref:IMP cyclohydrolase / Phosphoribosylaminoimidazolecarboxamide formyltransferase n=1 Tax=hydrothermal vent metagenome TaxID=652676 RepID=A0A3B0T4L8_9ZZZZ